MCYYSHLFWNMITNSELEAGCLFPPDVQKNAQGIGFVHSHLQIALSHTGSGHVEGELDGDAFVLLQQLRYASLVIRSIPQEIRRSFNDDEKEVWEEVHSLTRGFAYSLLKKGETQTVEKKRSALNLLREFDKLTLNRAELFTKFHPNVQAALDLADHYKQLGILMRFYRLSHYHPKKEIKDMANQVLFVFLMPALNHVGGSRPNDQSPDELSDIMSVLAKRENTEWTNMPTGTSPQVLDSWLRSHERDLLI